MTRKFHTEKHLKKRHFMRKDYMNSKEKMAALKPAEKPVVDEKTEQANQIVEKQAVELAKQPTEIKPTSVANVASAPPTMPQRIFQFARKKTALEKLKDKFHQFIRLF